MKPWLINFQGSRVIIVGGGHVSLKKTKEFLQEGAEVVVVSKEILADFGQLSCQMILKEYEMNDLQDAFMVYAATNNKDLNCQIMRDAKKKNILCGSATKDEANASSMRRVETEQLIAGIQCKNVYPAMTSLMKEDLKKYDDQLRILTSLRRYILDNHLVENDKRSEFFKNLLIMSQEELQVLQMFVLENKGNIFIFTGYLNEESINFSKECQALPISYRDEHLLEKSMIIDTLKIDFFIQPMVITYGQIYQRMKNCFQIKKLSLPLFENETILQNVYHNHKKRLFLIHSQSHHQLIDLLLKYGDVHELGHSLNNQNYDEIIPFVLQEGYHYRHDILSLECSLDKIQPVILKNDFLCSHIKEELKKKMHQ